MGDERSDIARLVEQVEQLSEDRIERNARIAELEAELAAMRSGAPPQPPVEALAEARGLGMEALRLLARLHGRRSDDRIWDFEEWADTQIGAFIAAHGHRSLVGLCEAFERMMETGEPPASQSTEPGREQVGAPPTPTRETLQLAQAAISSTWIVEPDDEQNPNAATIAWRELRAFLAGAPPEDS